MTFSDKKQPFFRKWHRFEFFFALNNPHAAALPGLIYGRQGNRSIMSLIARAEQCMSSFWRISVRLAEKILVTIIAITRVYHSRSMYPGTWYIYIFFSKCSGSDSVDKEGRISSILKSVQRSFSSDSHCFAVSPLEGNLISPPSESLIQTAGGWHRRTRETFTAVRTLWATMMHAGGTQKEQLLCKRDHIPTTL